MKQRYCFSDVWNIDSNGVGDGGLGCVNFCRVFFLQVNGC